MLAGQPVPHRMALTAVFEGYVTSSRYSGTEYKVCLLADGTWTCTCNGYGYAARSDGLCKHIDFARGERERRMTLAFLLC